MKKYNLRLFFGAALLISGVLIAAEIKSYQVTGPVLDVTPSTITVQKGTEKWEIARDSNTKVTGELKPGAKVTIYYKMIAQEVEVKSTKDTKPKNTTKTSP